MKLDERTLAETLRSAFHGQVLVTNDWTQVAKYISDYMDVNCPAGTSNTVEKAELHEKIVDLKKNLDQVIKDANTEHDRLIAKITTLESRIKTSDKNNIEYCRRWVEIKNVVERMLDDDCIIKDLEAISESFRHEVETTLLSLPPLDSDSEINVLKRQVAELRTAVVQANQRANKFEDEVFALKQKLLQS